MKYFYQMRCDPDLDVGFCAMWCTPYVCTWCIEQLSNPWLPNLDKNLQTRYDIEPKTCKYSSILRGYNEWYIYKLTLKKRNNKAKLYGD